MLTRRVFIGQLATLAALGIGCGRGPAQGHPPSSPPVVTVYESPACGCCGKWIDTLHAQGFRTIAHQEQAMDSIKHRLGVPRALRSCHTAKIENYVIEGHVPAEDLRRLLSERPGVAGLAAPGMPGSSPGMAVPGAPMEPYEVVAFRSDGSTELYARH